MPALTRSDNLTTSQPSLQRKGACACGGGCPRCQGQLDHTSVQAKLTVSTPGDQYEQEADRLADQIVRMPDHRSGIDHRNPGTQIQRQCDACDAGAAYGKYDEAQEDVVQTKKTTLGSAATNASVPNSFLQHLGSGQPLPKSLQTDFGPKLGHDLGNVRVHTGTAADAAAASVSARAFTLGRDVVFANGEFAPETSEGRRLIAHELVHWVQQGGQTNQIQRFLRVDARRSDDPATAIPQMTPLLQKLCPDFEVDQTNGRVTAKTGSDCAKKDFAGVASGSQKLGCCCLCTLVKTSDSWKIIVTIKSSPTTDASSLIVRMTPTAGASVPDLRYWTGGATETMVSFPPQEALGHELCGHAALSQARAHPPDETKATRRTFSDIHDPTVKIQNELAGPNEMNLGSTPRGLATASSAHRGESLRVFAVGPFAADSDAISAATQAMIDGAAAFADGNPDKVIDIIGFSDSNDTNATIGQTRADAVRQALDTRLKQKKDVGFILSPGAKATKFKRLQPATDGGAGTTAVVEIRLATEPAGLVALPSGAALSATVTHVNPELPKRVENVIKNKKSTGNACHDLLITTAWK